LDVPLSYPGTFAAASAEFSIWSDASGQPGAKLASFTVAGITSEARVYSAARLTAPCVLKGDTAYWLVGSTSWKTVNWNFDNNSYSVKTACRRHGGDWVVGSSLIPAFTIHGSGAHMATLTTGPEAAGHPPESANSANYRFDIRCEGTGPVLATVKVTETAGRSVGNWQIQIPTTATLNLERLVPDNYYLRVTSSGYAGAGLALQRSANGVQTNLFGASRHGTGAGLPSVMLCRKRYAVFRYACNFEDSHDLSPEKAPPRRVVVSNMGAIPELRYDWWIRQQGTDLYFEARRSSANFGFAKAPKGATFDQLRLAPQNDQYVANKMPATRGLIFFVRNGKTNFSDHGYAKIEVEDVTEHPPSNLQVVEGHD
jgi:hypothetical protein